MTSTNGRWSYKQAIAYLNSFIDFERQPEPRLKTSAKDIERFRKLLTELGNPHLCCPTIHVAGTKGKGSTSLLLASILQAAGYKTGLYTSPHLVSVRERVIVSGHQISKRSFASLMSIIAAKFENIKDGESLAFRTVFELLTALGFLEFKSEKVDIAIIEAGLGAKLDATIVVEPLISLMTPIGLDHMSILGATVDLIANDKSHIFKAGTINLSAPQQEEAKIELDKRATSMGGSISYSIGMEEFEVEESSWNGTSFRSQREWLKDTPLTLALPGNYQLINLSLVLDCVEELKKAGYKITREAVEIGLASARWPGRMQRIERNPIVILDGAHNTLAIKALVQSLDSAIGSTSPEVVFSSIAGKPVDEMANALCGKVRRFHIAPLQFPKGLPIGVIADAVRKGGGEYIEYADTPSALAGAKQFAGREGAVVVTGSLYLVSEILRHKKGLSLGSKNGGIDDSI